MIDGASTFAAHVLNEIFNRMKEQFRRAAPTIGETGLAALRDSCVTVVLKVF